MAFLIKSGPRIAETRGGAAVAGDVFIVARSHCSRSGVSSEAVKKRKRPEDFWKHSLVNISAKAKSAGGKRRHGSFSEKERERKGEEARMKRS